MQSNLPLFERLGIEVIAASADGEVGARIMTEDNEITFPIGYSVDAEQIEAVGAVSGVRQERTIVQPAEFVLNPDGIVMASMYSTTQLGRMNPREVLQFIKSRMD